MRTLARVLLVALVAHAAALAAPAGAQSQDNTAVAVNKKDGKSVFKLAFSVKKATGDVDAANTAVAYSSCTDCKTVAAAIQVVLVSGDSSSVTPQNVAVAINYECSECETLAAAYQFVYGDGQEVQFTKEGKQRLHDLKKRFFDLRHRDDLTLDQLAAEIAAIAAEVAVVVDTEVELKKGDPAPAAVDPTTTTTTTTTTTGVPPPSTSAPPSSTTTAPAVGTTVPAPTTTTPATPSAVPAPSTTTAVP
jgi:putative peptide zinc metalloprotease protein